MRKDSRKVIGRLRQPRHRGPREADFAASNGMEEALAAERHAGCGGGLAPGSIEGYPTGTYKGWPLVTCTKCGTMWQRVDGELVIVNRQPWRKK